MAVITGWLLLGTDSLRAAADPVLRVNGVEYVEAPAFFGRYGLTTEWLEANRRVRISSVWTTIELESDSRESLLNGMRVFLGEPVILRRSTLHLSRVDAERLFAPVLRSASIDGPTPSLKTIVLDPGHGGRDTGTHNAGLKLEEKILTLDVARRLKTLLEQQGYQVILTRSDDRFIELEERAALATRHGADLFVSIHFNAVANGSSVRGTETYIMTPRTHASTQPERDQSMIPTAYPGNRMDPWNAVLGYQMHRHLLDQLETSDRGLKRARFKVLTLLSCPGVLIESGYLSNDAEARRIGTVAYRERLAAALSAGIHAYGIQLHAAAGR